MQEKNENINISGENLNSEIEKYKKVGLFKTPTKKLINSIDLEKNEIILINLKILPFRSIFKNNIREESAKYLILTTRRIYFINQGWVMRYNESISYADVTEIFTTIKKENGVNLPVINIKVLGDSYEIQFHEFSSLRKKIGKINGIVECIKKRNPRISLSSNLKEGEKVRDIFKDIFSTKISFK